MLARLFAYGVGVGGVQVERVDPDVDLLVPALAGFDRVPVRHEHEEAGGD